MTIEQQSRTGIDPDNVSRPRFATKPGISFCHVLGRTIFLDLAADRYFCLSPAGERSFVKLAAHKPLHSDDIAVLEQLTEHGPLAQHHGVGDDAIVACLPREPPRCSLLDQEIVASSWRETGGAATALASARLRLRLLGVRRVIARLARRKRTIRTTSDRRHPAAVAAAFAGLRMIATETDNCLTRSLAIAERLVSVGATPVLTIGVKLQPFAAHAWVECDGALVNDRHEFVFDYTPILVV